MVYGSWNRDMAGDSIDKPFGREILLFHGTSAYPGGRETSSLLYAATGY